MAGLLNQMFQCGLTQTLIDALRELSVHIPSLLETIQHRLINKLSLVLGASLHTHISLPFCKNLNLYQSAI